MADRVGELHHRMRRQHRIDLTQLDPEPPDLHLKITTPQKLQNRRPVRSGHPPDHITRAIHPPTRTERTRHEPPRRQPRPMHIPARQTGAEDVEFAAHPGRDRTQPLIQHHQIHTHRRRPDTHRPPGHQRTGRRRHDRRLTRTVRIDHDPARRPPRHQLRRTHITGHHHRLQMVQTTVIERRQRRRRAERMRHPVFGKELRQLRATENRGRRHHQRRPRTHRHHQLEHRRIETRRREMQHPRPHGHAKAIPLIRRQIHHTPMRDRHTLRPTRRPRRINHIRRMIHRQHTRAVGVRNRIRRIRGHGRPKLVVVQYDPVRALRQTIPQRGRRHTDRRTTILQHERDPVSRITRIHRNERRPRLRHRPHTGHGLDRPRQRQRHGNLRADLEVDQETREPVRHLVQCAVAQGDGGRPVPGCDEGIPVRVAADGAGQQVRQRDGCESGAPGGGHQTAAFAVVEDLEVADPSRSVGVGGEERAEEPAEASVMGGEGVFGVQVGVGLEVQVEAGAGDPVIDVHGEVGDGAGRQQFESADDAAEGDLVVEQHDVDQWAVEALMHRWRRRVGYRCAGTAGAGAPR